MRRIDGVRYLVWDLYGTLLISGAGDLSRSQTKEKTLRALLGDEKLPSFSLVTHLHNLIAQEHSRARKNGVSFPEVEIREIWQHFFTSLQLTCPRDLDNFALRYELANNPVNAMPSARAALTHKATLGLISNAQFYTPLILEALNLPAPDKALYSYKHRQSKPGSFLFEQFLKDGPPPEEILYIGNDRLSDIAPAHQAGMRTALFAGDLRSYRPRTDRTDLPTPDAVITSLAEIW
ncbi:HAD family hydrolase, partial [Akkermansiaceae bacterium]|nr:HAD family hydrolase [Akkermansiaceae bacterium]